MGLRQYSRRRCRPPCFVRRRRPVAGASLRPRDCACHGGRKSPSAPGHRPPLFRRAALAPYSSGSSVRLRLNRSRVRVARAHRSGPRPRPHPGGVSLPQTQSRRDTRPPTHADCNLTAKLLQTLQGFPPVQTHPLLSSVQCLPHKPPADHEVKVPCEDIFVYGARIQPHAVLTAGSPLVCQGRACQRRVDFLRSGLIRFRSLRRISYCAICNPLGRGMKR